MPGISRDDLSNGTDIITILTDKTGIFPSRSEARKALAANAVAINKTKIADGYQISSEDVLLNRFILVSFGKKKNFVIPVA